jgi:RNA polymerase-binding transcription factor DksA
MTETEMEKYRQTLVRQGHRLNGNVARLSNEALRTSGGEASGNLSNTPVHLADLGSDAFEGEMTLDLLETEGRLQQEIAAALVRIEHGTFGKCENCKCKIPRGRLEAVPYTRFCVTCARAEEKAS